MSKMIMLNFSSLNTMPKFFSKNQISPGHPQKSSSVKEKPQPSNVNVEEIIEKNSGLVYNTLSKIYGVQTHFKDEVIH